MTDSMPNARSSGAIAITATAVVQLGPAMMPRVARVALVDLGHHQRHRGVEPERGRLIDHDRAGLDHARRPLARDRRRGRADHEVQAGETPVLQRLDR